jgi:photosystem II stability/assembly factor-like uncharacterized protein
MPRFTRLLVVSAAAAALAIAITPVPPLDAAGRADQATATQVAPVPADPALLNLFRWRSLGPDRGGRSIAVSGVKGRPNEAYFGAVGGGLWKTTDRGETWAPVTDGQITSASVGAVAVSESNPDLVFIGMGESCIRGNIMPGDGVYKSTDAGKTWTRSGFTESQAISRIRIHPTNADVVFVASFGKYGAASDERGVFKSTDGGRNWRRTLFRDAKTGAVDLVIDRKNPDVLYAALWEAYRLEYQMSSGGPGSGLYKSIDGGETWTEITRNPGLPAGVVGRIGVAVSGADSNRVYALVENERGGLYRSNDAGATWTLVNENRNIRQRAFYYTHVATDPQNADTVYLLNVQAFRSADGGRTLTNIGAGTHSDHHDLWIDPDDPRHLVIGNDGGGAVSYSGGQAPQPGGAAWSAQDFPTPQYYHVVTTKHVPYHLCGAQQDGQTVCLPSEGGGGGGRGGGGRGGAAAPATYNPGGAEPGYIAPDPKDPDVFYAGSNNGGFMDKLNRKTGERREVHPYPRMFSGEPASALVERVQWTYPIIFSPVDPTVLYTATQHVWKTTNGGQDWDKISGDLTKHDPKTLGLSGGPITHDMNGPEVYATVFAIGPGKTDVNIIWAGSDDGLVHVTRDSGRTWANVTPQGMPEFGRVSIIDASAFNAGTAYIAVKRPLLNDLSPYIFRTQDFGRTWRKIVSGLGPLDYVHVVREDPLRRGLLYAGTQHGVYYSPDDGETWRSLSLNLPDVPISDLIVERTDLVIATHGRGFYILDDIAPIRQFSTAVVSASDIYLFKPDDAIRSAGGAAIRYWVKGPVSNLTIDVLDARGQVVRSFGAPAGGRGAEPGRAGGAGGGGAAGAGAAAVGGAGGGGAQGRGGGGGRGGAGGGGGAPAAPGLNTVTWDLRYPSATSFPGMILWGGNVTGPAAAPGTYQIRLTANDRTQTQPLVVRRHPWQPATDADLVAQFDLAIQIRDKVSEANNAVIQIRRIKDAAAERLTRSQDGALKTAAETLTRNLSAVEGEIYQVKNQSGQDPLNFPIKINNRLASLLSVVNDGDGLPIGNAEPIFTNLKADLKVLTDRLARVLATDLAAVNAQLRRLNLDVIAER